MKIRYVPYEELIVHEILEQDNASFFEDIVRHNITPQGYVVPSVNWIDGVAFGVAPLPPTEDIVKEQLAGRIHYASVVFTRTEFKAEIKVQIGKDTFPIRLRKADNNPTFVDLSKFVSDFKASHKPTPL